MHDTSTSGNLVSRIGASEMMASSRMWLIPLALPPEPVAMRAAPVRLLALLAIAVTQVGEFNSLNLVAFGRFFQALEGSIIFQRYISL